jgi:hypothetical protein
MASQIYTGKGAKIFIAPLPDGVDTEPVAATPTVATTAPAKGATTITITALPADVFIPAGVYLSFKDADGYEVLVKLTADAEGGDTTLTVAPLPEGIDIGAAAEWPLRLRGRTGADLDRSGNRVTTVTFDDDAYERGLTTTISLGLSMAGNWSPLDAGYASAELWFTEGKQQCYFFLELPNPRSTVFSKGRVYKGPGSITGMPLSVPADGIITGNIDAAFNGKPDTDEPTVIP